MKSIPLYIFLTMLLSGWSKAHLYAQSCNTSAANSITKCVEIESILVDACTTNEGLDEMARIRIGPNPMPLNSLVNVTWTSNNPWQGYATFNASNISKLATINNEIAQAGNCGKVIKVNPGETIPAYGQLLLITSTVYDVYAQDFSGLTDTLYVALQNNTTVTTGHFNNYGTQATRTFIFGTSTCTDTVTYDRSLLRKADGSVGAENGSTVYFTNAGVPTYGNTGCKIPSSIFSVDAGTVNPSYCKSDLVPLYGHVSGAICYKWHLKNPLAGTITDSTNLYTYFTANPTFSGPVKVYLTVYGNCNQVKTDSVEFNILALTDTLKIISPGTVTRCNKNALALQAIGSSASTISWSHSGKGILTINSNSNVIYTPSDIDTGTVWFKVTQFVTCGKLTDSVSVHFAASPKADFTPSTILVCANIPVVALNPVDTGGAFTSIFVTGTDFINPKAAGVYSIKHVISRYGCADSVQINIEVRDTVNAQFTVSDTLVCKNTSPITITTVQNGGVFSGATIQNKTFSTQTAGIFYIQYKIDNGACADSTTQVVHVEDKGDPNFSVPDSVLCEGDNAITFQSLNEGGIYSGSYVSDNSFNPLKAGYYTVYYKYGTGNCADSSLHHITVLPKPVASFTSGPKGVKVYDTAYFAYTGSSVQSYDWQFGDGHSSSVMNPSHVYTKDRVFPVSLIVQNEVGCFDTAYNSFLVKADVHFYVPNAFTPNFDGNNDQFMVSYTGIKTYQIRIYNRWGQEVYQSANIDEGWDGTCNQKECESDVYVYAIEYIDSNGGDGKQSGNVTLLR